LYRLRERLNLAGQFIRAEGLVGFPYALAIALIGFSAFAEDLPNMGKTPGVSRAGLSKAMIGNTDEVRTRGTPPTQ
jgi:hypothetical protein